MEDNAAKAKTSEKEIMSKDISQEKKAEEGVSTPEKKPAALLKSDLGKDDATGGDTSNSPLLAELKQQIAKFSPEDIKSLFKMIQPDAKEVKFAPGFTPPETTPTRLRPHSYSEHFTPGR